MRINRFLASVTGMSRRAADDAIAACMVLVNGAPAKTGHAVIATDTVTFKGKPYRLADAESSGQTILLNKPRGYVVSRDGQGSRTVYDLLPPELHNVKPVGRLDKDSSGLLLLTTDGDLANQLTHPRYQKIKVYEVTLDKPLEPLHHQMINDFGITLDDGPSKLQLERLRDGDSYAWRITMSEGRNRQIRRTFSALGYAVTALHRTNFGSYSLDNLKTGQYRHLHKK